MGRRQPRREQSPNELQRKVFGAKANADHRRKALPLGEGPPESLACLASAYATTSMPIERAGPLML